MSLDESTDSGQVDFSAPSAASEIEGLMNSGEQETPTPAEPSTEKEQTETAPSQEGEKAEAEGEKPEAKSDTPDATKEVPLHKDSRWQEKQRETEFLKTQLAEQKAMIDQLMTLAKPQQQKADEEIPQAFVRAFGTGDLEADKKAWAAYRPVIDLQKEIILKELAQQQQQEQEKQGKFAGWLDQQVLALQGKGTEITKDEFLEIIKEFEPSSGLQSYDAEKVVKIHNLKKELADLKVSKEKEKAGQKQAARKDVAALSSTSQPKSESKEFFTLDDSPSWKQRLKKLAS